MASTVLAWKVKPSVMPPSNPLLPPSSSTKQAQSPAAPPLSAAASKPLSGTTPSSPTTGARTETAATVNSRRARLDFHGMLECSLTC